MADSLLVGQHVDVAILSVLKDASKVPNVYEACERLRSGGHHRDGGRRQRRQRRRGPARRRVAVERNGVAKERKSDTRIPLMTKSWTVYLPIGPRC